MKSAAAAGGSRVCKYVAQTEKKKKKSAWKPPLCPGSHSVLIFYSFELVAIYAFPYCLSARVCSQRRRPLCSEASGQDQGRGEMYSAAGRRTLAVPAWLRASPQAIVTGKWSTIAFIRRLQSGGGARGCRASADRCWRWGQSNVKKEEREPRRHLDPCDKRRSERFRDKWLCVDVWNIHAECVTILCVCVRVSWYQTHGLSLEAGGLRQLLPMLYVKSLRSSWIGFTPSHLSNGANAQKRFWTFNRAKVHLNLSHTQETHF